MITPGLTPNKKRKQLLLETILSIHLHYRFLLLTQPPIQLLSTLHPCNANSMLIHALQYTFRTSAEAQRQLLHTKRVHIKQNTAIYYSIRHRTTLTVNQLLRISITYQAFTARLIFIVLIERNNSANHMRPHTRSHSYATGMDTRIAAATHYFHYYSQFRTVA